MNIKLQSSAGTFDAKLLGKGPLVICLHGFPDNWSSYDKQVDALVSNGFSCLVPKMRGYQSSSIPADERFALVDLADDVESWRQQLAVEKFHLVGHDWGALTSYIYAAKYSDRLLSLVTLAVPPLNQLQKTVLFTPKQLFYSWYIFFFQLRGISEKALARNDFSLVEWLWRRWSPGFQWDKESMDSIKTDYGEPGVSRAVLQYYRDLIKSVLSRSHDDLLKQELEVPTLVMAGEQDGCLSIDLYQKAIQSRYFPKGVQFKRFPNAGHFLHQEVPEELNPILVEWLRSHTI